MNYYQARKRLKDGRWDFTWRNDDRIAQHSCCREHDPETHVAEARQVSWWPLPLPPDPPLAPDAVAGHDTPEDAERCFYEWEMRNEVREREWSNAMYRCAVCGTWTQKYLEVGRGIGTPYPLCSDHLNVVSLRQVRPFRPGIAWAES